MIELRDYQDAGGLIEKAGEFEEARQRIRDEANRKRADAANARRDESGKLTMKPVVPQSEGQQAKNGPNPDQNCQDEGIEPTFIPLIGIPGPPRVERTRLKPTCLGR